MKRLILLLGMLPAAVFGQTSFCISVKDVCCNAEASTGTHQLQAQDEFPAYYIDYDATADHLGANIRCFLDDILIWERAVCGSGQTSMYYPTAGARRLRIEVDGRECEPTPGASKSGTVQVTVQYPDQKNERPDAAKP